MTNENEAEKPPEAQPSAISILSLSQALLAPLDAIFKAQIHAARSFLNMLLQIGYPHIPVDADGHPAPKKGTAYNQDFYYETEMEGKRETRKVSIPALALLPVTPLAVESALFKLEMSVDSVEKHTQMQDSERKATGAEGKYGQTKRPWFLVSEPISIQGRLAPPKTGEGEKGITQGTSIQIEIKVGKTPMPSGLDKLLTFLTESSYTEKGGT